MMLPFLLLVPLIGGMLSWMFERWTAQASRWIAVGSLGLNLGLVLSVWFLSGGTSGDPWLARYQAPWLPGMGISFLLAMDGFSLLLVAMANLLGLMAVLISWHSIQHRIGFFHACVQWEVATLCGVFLSLDLILFYFFWELLLVPLFLLIVIWGQEYRVRAALKFFVYAQAGGLFLLLAILGFHVAHARATGVLTFDYFQWLESPVAGNSNLWIMMGFVVAFLIKLPAVPLHGWLPDTQMQAPAAGNVDLTGLIIKVGAYGLIRFVVPLFPDTAAEWSMVGAVLGVAGILYGAVTAFSQTDVKRFIAYTSISHMGFVLLAVSTWNPIALQGAVVLMLAHALGAAALFMLTGVLFDRLQTRDLRAMGGLWSSAPRMGGWMLFFALAVLGLPGMGTFVGEFLVLLGVFQDHREWAVVAASGLVLSALYSLSLVQRIFQGTRISGRAIADLRGVEMAPLLLLALLLVWLGVHPQPVLRLTDQAIRAMHKESAPYLPVRYHVMRETANPAAAERAEGGPLDAATTGESVSLVVGRAATPLAAASDANGVASLPVGLRKTQAGGVP